jgi:hypothetical protein
LEEVERQKGTQMLQSIKKMLFARKQIWIYQENIEDLRLLEWNGKRFRWFCSNFKFFERGICHLLQIAILLDLRD